MGHSNRNWTRWHEYQRPTSTPEVKAHAMRLRAEKGLRLDGTPIVTEEWRVRNALKRAYSVVENNGYDTFSNFNGDRDLLDKLIICNYMEAREHPQFREIYRITAEGCKYLGQPVHDWLLPAGTPPAPPVTAIDATTGVIEEVEPEDRTLVLKANDALANIETAKQLLAASSRVDEVKTIKDRAEAARVMARKLKLSEEAQQHAAEIRIRAERRMGELLREAKETGERETRGGDRGNQFSPKSHDVTLPTPPKLADLGISKMESSRAQAIAEVPAEDFEKHIEQVKESHKELTSADLVRTLVKKNRQRKVRQERNGKAASVSEALGQYAVLLADPPWQYEHVETLNRAIDNHYPTMTLADICALPVRSITYDDAVLFLWATSPKLAEAMQVIEAWGFTYRTCAVWVKDKIGMGYYFRQQHELVLVAARGSLPVPPEAVRPPSVFEAPRLEHSRKPDTVHEFIERMYPEQRKVELFARRPRDGWFIWGNEHA
jgi:N6-adenosine-specific RNA methylase IME4